MKCLEVSLLWQYFFADFFSSKIMLVWKWKITFSGKNNLLVCHSQKNQIAYKTLIKEKLFHKFPRHWATRGPNSLYIISLFPAFTIAANFSRADPGAKRRKEGLAFSKNNCQVQSPGLSQKSSCSILFLFFFLSLSLSRSLSLSHSLSLSLFLFLPLFSLLLPFNSKKEVEKVTQSTCWTPFTTSNTSTTHTTHITSSLAKK